MRLSVENKFTIMLYMQNTQTEYDLIIFPASLDGTETFVGSGAG